MATFDFTTVQVGFIQTNCHIVRGVSGAVYVVDPGGEEDVALRAIERFSGGSAAGILLTHGHVDHIGAVPALAARLGAPVFLAEGDAGLYRSPANALPPWLPAVEGLPAPVHRFFADGDAELVPTPGHTPGSVCFAFDDGRGARVLFTGDTLFEGSIGRTDLPGGDHKALMDSLRRLFERYGDAAVHPGHGGSTTLAAERMWNPHVAEALAWQPRAT